MVFQAKYANVFFCFREGSKFKKYGATSNIILRNGISLAAGLNGDLQLWDIATGEYEGNLYHDPNVKDKSNPGMFLSKYTHTYDMHSQIVWILSKYINKYDTHLGRYIQNYTF